MFLEIAQHSCALLCLLGVCCLRPTLALPCFFISWSGSPPEKVRGLELDLERFLALVYCLRGPSFKCYQTRRGQAYSLRGPRLLLRPAKILGFCLFPLMSQTNVRTQRGPGSGLLPLRSQTYAWACQDLWFLPIPSEVPGSLTPALAEVLAQV